MLFINSSSGSTTHSGFFSPLSELKNSPELPIDAIAGCVFTKTVGEATMSLVTWDESYSVRVAECDEDHKKLFALINTLYDAMLAGKGAQVVGKVVQELVDYSKLHFAAEESLLEKTSYPALGPHRVQHREFVKRVEQFQQDLAAGKTVEPRFVANYVMVWWTKHIRQTDQQYSAHLNAQDIS